MRDRDQERVLGHPCSERIDMEVNSMDPPYKPKVRKSTVLLLCLLVLTILIGCASPVFANEKYNGAALEWNLAEPLPNKIEVDEQFTIRITLVNEGTVDLTGGNKTTVELQVKGKIIDSTIVQLATNKSTIVNFKTTLDSEGNHEVP